MPENKIMNAPTSPDQSSLDNPYVPLSATLCCRENSSMKTYLLKIVPFVILPLFIMNLFGCAGVSEPIPEGYGLVGKYKEKDSKTKYTFKNIKDAEKLEAKLKKKGYEAFVKEIKKGDKTYYRVYAQVLQTSPDELKWPATGEPRIEYLGLLNETGGIAKTDEEEDGEKFLDNNIFGTLPSLLKSPFWVSVDDSGKVFATDMRGEVIVYDTVAKKRFSIPLMKPKTIATSSDGRVYISDTELKAILVYKDKEMVSQIGGDGAFHSPFGLAIDNERSRLYVTDTKQNALVAYSLDGKFLFSVISPLNGNEGQRFGAPSAVAVNSKGEVFLIDQGGAKINVYTPNGEFVRSFGNRGLYPGQFFRPKGIAIDSDDNVYITDIAFDNFQVFDSQGRLLLVAGSGGNQPGKFNNPINIFIDKKDRIYVSDLGNHRVQVFQYLGNKKMSLYRLEGEEK